MGRSKAQKSSDLNDLKQEVKMDEHQVPIDELLTRFETNVERVSSQTF